MRLISSSDKKTNSSNPSSGFALPTILIASIIMLGVLLVSVVSTAAVSTSLQSQYYNQLAKNAADAGIAYANACLAANGGVPMWSDANPLTPGTDCAGNQLPGFTCATASTDARCSLSVSGGTVQVLLVGGGGGGGLFGGGGGAGGLINQNTQVTANSYPVVVGDGGAGAPNTTINATNGNDSSFNSIIAQGGGGGGTRNDAASYYARAGNPGGSGGGSSMGDSGPQQLGGLGVVGQGKNGGNGMIGTYSHGGGGGYGENGSNGAPNLGGKGGDGYQSSISGASLWYAGGGGGGVYNSGSGGAGGNGGGGAGGSTTVSPAAGYPNTGGGGGGYGYGPNNGYSGGSGVVIISYPTGSITATGGTTIDYIGGNTIHTFKGGGTFNVTAINSGVTVSTFSVGFPTRVNGKASKIKSVGSTQLLRASNGAIWRQYNQTSVYTSTDYSSAIVNALVVAGGGAGSAGGNGGGGGGGGGFLTGSVILTAGTMAVTVGIGGAGSTTTGTNGNDSVFRSMIAKGGGGGTVLANGSIGGSGSGAPASGTSFIGGTGTAGQGMSGGNNLNVSPYPGGGGGGAGANGSNGIGSTCGIGGVGLSSSISGVAVFYSGGGGCGGTYQGASSSAGGNGGGGAGAGPTGNATSGTSNTGGGGGGAGNTSGTSGNGGSGIVIISYPTSSIAASGGVVTTSGGNTIHTFTTSGNFVVGAGQRASCQAILNAGESTGNGMYWIYPTGSTGLNVYCDMTDDGGGWTLVLQNNAAVATPAPSWNNAINSNTILGTPSSDLTTFDQLVGLGFWNNIGTTLRAEVGALPTSISHKATYAVSLDSGNFYALGLSNQNILVGGNAPGLYNYHNNRPFSTYDADHSGSNCAPIFANHPWWYGGCWDGNFLAGGGGYQDAAYWTGSTSDYYAYGSIWLK